MSETKIDLDKMTLEEIASYVHSVLRYKSPFPNWKNAFEKLRHET